MKSKFLLAAFFGFAMHSHATVTLGYTFGVHFDSLGDAVPDGTLWALVVDHDANNTFAGFGLDGSLHAADQLSPGIADTFFTAGQSISLGGLVGGGTVFAMGGMNGGDGSTTGSLSSLDITLNGLAVGRNFAIYWFPGATFSGVESNPQTIENEVGGMQNATVDVIPAGAEYFNTGMVIPPDGSDISSIGGASVTTLAGNIADTSFTAVTLIPEPSTALLGAFGALALLRRRRVVQD